METDELDIEALDFFCALGNTGPKTNLAAIITVGSPVEASRKGKRNKAHNEQKLIATCQQNYKVPRPRIIKSDFRRYYANMWVNVFNACDYELMMRHLGTYYVRDVLVQQTDLREDQMYTPHAIPLFQQSAKGVEYLSQFWYKGMTAAPDLVCGLRHTFVKVRSDGTSAIKCCFVLKGTQISEVDSADPEGIAKIAKYQEKKASGIRGITITEAAIVAVAPARMVSLPRALKLQHGVSGAAGAASTTSSIRSGVSGASMMESIKTSQISDAAPRVKIENSIATTTACTATSSTCSTSADDISVCSDNEGSISTNASASNDGNPAYPALRQVSSKVIVPMHRSAPARVCSTDSPDTADTSACGYDDDTSTETACTKRRRVEKPDSCSSPSGTTDGRPRSTGGKIKDELHCPASSTALLDTGGKVDWLALADDAYESGALEPATSHHEKQYFNSDPSLDGVGSAASAMPLLLTAEAGAGTGTGTVVVKKEGCEAAAAERGLEELKPVEPVACRKTVITACLDCICSIELEMNADCKIISVVLNYFR